MFKNTPKGAATRQRLYDVSLVLFRSKGFEATTMRDVAAEAGVSLGAAYHYFEGKDAIVATYYEEVHTRHAERVGAELPHIKKVSDRLKLVIGTKLDIVAADRPLLGALLRYTGEPSHPLSFLGRGTRSLQMRGMALFADALGDESLPDDVRALAPVLLWAMQMGILLYFLYDGSPRQRRTRQLADRGVDLFVGALKLAKLPPLRPFRSRVRSLLDDAGLLPASDDIAKLTAASSPTPRHR